MALAAVAVRLSAPAATAAEITAPAAARRMRAFDMALVLPVLLSISLTVACAAGVSLKQR